MNMKVKLNISHSLPDLNIIEPLWGVLEERLRKCFPPLASHSDLATVLQDEWQNCAGLTSVIPKMN